MCLLKIISMNKYQIYISKHQAEREMNKERNKTCKNSLFKLKTDKDGEEGLKFGYAQAGCKNKRKNGSAYCGKCKFITK